MTYHRVCNYINTTGATKGAGTAYASGAPEVTPGFMWDLISKFDTRGLNFQTYAFCINSLRCAEL
jgi:hypothetical protein